MLKPLKCQHSHTCQNDEVSLGPYLGPYLVLGSLVSGTRSCFGCCTWSQQELGIAIGLTLTRPSRASRWRASRRARVTCRLCFSLQWGAMLVQWHDRPCSVVCVYLWTDLRFSYDREYECPWLGMSPQNSLDMCSQHYRMRLRYSQYYYSDERRAAMCVRCLPQLSRNLATCSASGGFVGQRGWHHLRGGRFDALYLSHDDHFGVFEQPIILQHHVDRRWEWIQWYRQDAPRFAGPEVSMSTSRDAYRLECSL